MAFAQLTYRESLRDIEACLRPVGGKLYHMGFRGKVARSTLADANEPCRSLHFSNSRAKARSAVLGGNTKLPGSLLPVVSYATTERAVTWIVRVEFVRGKGKIEIKKDGSVNGELTTAQIIIEDGAYFKGSIEIDRSADKEADRVFNHQ
jgi:hypothetical protein